MRNRMMPACFLAGFFVFSSLASLAQQPRASIQILATFDYPGEGNSTLPQKINDGGEIVGHFRDSSGSITRGFIRFRDGSFSAPIVEPNDTGNQTQLRGVNNLGDTCGFYLNAIENTAHGFFLSGNIFTEFDVTDALNTYIHALNDAGDFCGTFDTSTGNQGYVSISGSVLPFSVPGAGTTTVFGMNNSDKLAGEYADSASVLHGFFRDADGTLTFPIDPPGAISTILFGINDRDLMVGRYDDAFGASHAFLFQRPDKFLVFDYPGATFTSFNGINRQGVICGRYQDSAGIGHGIIVRVRRGTGGTTPAEISVQKAPLPVRPSDQLPIAWRGAMPPE